MMEKLDLSSLPKFRDGSTFLYVERARVDRDEFGIRLSTVDGEFRFPCAEVSTLMLGPGTSISHAAVSELAKFGCLAAWCGEQGVRFYASGLGETRSARNLHRQAALWANPETRKAVARRMYFLRFKENPDVSIETLRGMEGVRVRTAYAHAAERFGIVWNGRSYKKDDWSAADPVNRALSVANTCLYGVCHAGIVSFGFSPALGFVHSGRMTSFVYDISDLYKMEMAVPAAFNEAKNGALDLERRVRVAMRESFRSGRLLERIEKDVFHVLDVECSVELDPAGFLAGDSLEEVESGINHGDSRSP
jgi:CRISPR-associated protein Cas1